jgi:YgiT-type zinc finger domain-containing protein
VWLAARRARESVSNTLKAQIVTCNGCGDLGVQIRYVTRSYGKGAKVLLIENIPVVVCPHCGESYLTAETLHELERIKLHRRSLAKPRKVAVVSFG